MSWLRFVLSDVTEFKELCVIDVKQIYPSKFEIYFVINRSGYCKQS